LIFRTSWSLMTTMILGLGRFVRTETGFEQIYQM
jgi:hypothetical protein